MTDNNNKIRLEYKIIVDSISNNSKVLDLGCGKGEVLQYLKTKKNCLVTGVEIDEKEIYKCVEKGISVLHDDIDTALSDFSDKSFDFVILHESLQQVLNPQDVILESLRVGKKAIVGIPNFCNLFARFQIFFQGRVPVTKELPYEWFDTPNLRFLSLKDFKNFCKKNHITILSEIGITNGKIVPFRPNCLANTGIFIIQK